MERLTESKHGMWSNSWMFVLAAAGSAVGLGNIWKFPYITGENGGGAFVLLYLGCIALVGIPIMMAEVLIGREGRYSPINSVRALIQQHKSSRIWVVIGWMGMLAGFLILSYYAVIAGWALHYIVQLANGSFTGATAEFANDAFNSLLADPWRMVFWQTVFLGLTIVIVARGVTKGLETAIRWFMPMLLILLVVLLGYGANSSGFEQGFDFMFSFQWESITSESVLIAMGQAFFTLSLGMGAIMAYGSYMPSNASITKTVITIAVLDTVVAIAAGLAIFPIVFANGLEPSQGPGLMFVTIPLAFGQMPFGALFGVMFFALVSFAAITSAISLTEPALAYLVEQYNAKRSRVAVSVGVICWILGIGTVLSFNVWADQYIVGELNFFEFIDYVSQNIMLPLGGVLIALFAAYALPSTVVGSQLGLRSGPLASIWKLVIGVVAPLAVLAVLIVPIADIVVSYLGLE